MFVSEKCMKIPPCLLGTLLKMHVFCLLCVLLSIWGVLPHPFLQEGSDGVRLWWRYPLAAWWLWEQGLCATAWQTSRAAASLFVWREAMAMGPSLSFVAGIKNLVCKQEPLFRFTRHACGGRRPLFRALVPRKWEGTLREGSWSPGCLLHVEPRTKVGR